MAVVASALVAGVFGLTLLILWRSPWHFERSLLVVLIVGLLLFGSSIGVQLHYTHLVEEAFEVGGEAYGVALSAYEGTRELAKWTALETLGFCTVASAVGIYRGIFWAVFVLIVLLSFDLFVASLLIGGYPSGIPG